MPFRVRLESVVASAALALLLSGCAGGAAKPLDNNYPKDSYDRRKERNGRLTGDGLIIAGGGKNKKGGAEGGSVTGLGVNSYIWRAVLDTVGFMPLQSADPFGGVVLTDWYEDPETPGEQFKINAMILGTELRSNNVKVRLFRRVKEASGEWKDQAPAEGAARAVEDRILARAKELRSAEGK